MALAHTDRLPVRLTLFERAALGAARCVERLVASRTARRREQLTRFIAQREAERRLQVMTDDALMRAHGWPVR